MTRSVLFFSILPGRRDEFVAGFRGSRCCAARAGSRASGARSCTCRSTASDEVLVTADWDSPEAYQGWLDNPVRAEIQAELGPLLAADPVPRVFEVVEDAGPCEDEA